MLKNNLRTAGIPIRPALELFSLQTATEANLLPSNEQEKETKLVAFQRYTIN